MKAIYARQSLEKKNSLSIDGQIDLCKKHIADGEDYTVYSESKSGKNTSDRSRFLQLLSDIKLNKISTVIVYRLDRISRNVLDFCSIWDIFKQHNVQFVSCNENFDTSTPMGEAMIMIAMVFAQMERTTIVERITDNYFKRAEQGFYLGGYAPFGLKKIDIVYKNKKTAGYDINPEQIEILRYMFEQYANTNISLGKIGFALTEQGCKTTKGNNWSTCNIGRVLRNPVYVRADAKVYQYLQSKGASMNNNVDEYLGENGCYIYAPQSEPSSCGLTSSKRKKSGRKFSDLSHSFVTIAPHMGVISSDIWLKCQYKLDNNKQVKCDRSGTHSWLSGIMRCANCGYGVTVVNNNRGKNYVNCYGKKTHKCKGREKAWQLFEIEDLAQEELLKRLRELSHIEAKEILQDEPADVENFRKESIKLEKRIDNLLDELENAKEENSETRVKSIRKRLDSLSGDLDAVNKQIGKLLNENNNRKNNLNCDFSIEYILENWDSDLFSMEERQKIARTFIQHVIVGDQDISVVFY